MIQPDFDGFAQLAKQGNLIPIYREIMADLDTPVTAYLKLAADAPHAFLLESVQGGEKWGRYSLIGTDPSAIFSAKGREVRIERPGEKTVRHTDADFMQILKAELDRHNPVDLPGLPRFHGGAVGYMGYDMVRSFEKIPDANPDTLGTPDALFMMSDAVVIFDNLLGKIKLTVNARIEDGIPLQQIYDTATTRIERMLAQLRQPLPEQKLPPAADPVTEADFEPEIEREAFEESVRQAKQYIAAGDIMQVVLSQRLSIPFPHPPHALYRALRATNPSPYLYLLKMGDMAIVGSSPEILVRQEEKIATVRPIAGTRPRGRDEAEDKALEKELLADPKERAEHIMLVDLGRNDLGRISKIGSVHVTDQFFIERYSHVMHIVSNVEGELLEDKTAFDVVAATFPAGTVSGAPKIRAMEIIDELETSRRGPYAGTVGYFSYSGHMDLAITIRTAVIKDGRLSIQAGAGIVADSQPDREFEETMNKARAIFRAVDLVQQGLE